MDSSKKIEFVFPESDLEITPTKRGSEEQILHKFSTSIDDIASWFSKYEIDCIELWISGAIETEGILKLAVSAKGEGGLKLTLRPKNQTIQ